MSQEPEPKKKKIKEINDKSEADKSSSEVQMFSPQCQASFAVYFTCKCRDGERKERRGGEKEEEEELEGFDAMQTGSTKARRQKFSIHHKNKSALVPALAQSHCKEGQRVRPNKTS